MSRTRDDQNEELINRFKDSANVKKILSDSDSSKEDARKSVMKMAEPIFDKDMTKNMNRTDLEKLCEIAIAIAPVVASGRKIGKTSNLDMNIKKYFNQYLDNEYGIDQLINNFYVLLKDINSQIDHLKGPNVDLLRAEVATCMTRMQQLSTNKLSTNKDVATPLADYDTNKSTALITSGLRTNQPTNHPVTNATAASSTLRQPEADELRYWFNNKDDARRYVGDLGNRLQDLLNKEDPSIKINFLTKASANPQDLRVTLTSQSVMSKADADEEAKKISAYFEKNLFSHNEKPTIKVVKSASESQKQMKELFRVEIEPLEVMKAMILDSINKEFGFVYTKDDIFARHVKDFPKMDKDGKLTFVCPKDNNEKIGPKTTADFRQMAMETLDNKLEATSPKKDLGSLPPVERKPHSPTRP